MTPAQKELIEQFEGIVGSKNVLTQPSKTIFYKQGFRFGGGDALAVVLPRTLLEQWLTIKVCVEQECAIIIQAANTGLTGGSTPDGKDYGRDVVIINTLKLDKIYLINKGCQAISLAGASLHSLESKLQEINRDPHSVIGSSQIGATVVGGIANNSGGALVKRGPAYTELSLYAQVDRDGNLNLINHLGIDELGETPEEILTNIQNGNINQSQVRNDVGMASDIEYIDWVRDVKSSIPARFNADSRRLFEASGCAGKVGVFAVRTDTFVKPKKEKIFYLGTNNPKKLATLRNDILTNFSELPNMAEYLHRTIFQITEEYGKDIFLAIRYLGTEKMPTFFRMRAKVESFLNKVPVLSPNLLNKALYRVAKLLPQHLPKRMVEYRDNYEHHLIVSVSDDGIEEMHKYLKQEWDKCPHSGFFLCTNGEGNQALSHRFAAAGAANNYRAINHCNAGDILALDVALPRNDKDWVDNLPKDVSDHIILPLYYGHFLCNVFHRNYILKKGVDKSKIKLKILTALDEKGAKYPAEHNVGHLYKADDNLQKFYKRMDPTNTFNPGIGEMNKYKESCNCCL